MTNQTPSDSRKCVSVVVPIYREAKNLPNLVARLNEVTQKLAEFDWEYVLVNDGSPDNSLDVLRQLASVHSKIRVVDLSRNFGKELALSAGVEFASGDAIICMDADLQHPPELIPEMIEHWKHGIEVVATIRKRMDNERLIRKAGSRAFYWIMRQISEMEIVSQTTDFRLIDRRVINALIGVRERQRLFRGIVDWLGFRKVWIEFEAAEREVGIPGYSLGKLLELAMNSFVAYSSFPLRFIGYLGIVISLVSGLLELWMLTAEHFFNPPFHYTPLSMFVVGNTFLTGITLSALGLISLYIRKIYAETSNRPLFVVREVINVSTEQVARKMHEPSYCTTSSLKSQ